MGTPIDAEEAARAAGYEGDFLDEFYGSFTSDREKEVLTIPLRLVAAWAGHDADGVAGVFAKDGVLILPGDVLKRSRDEIQAFMVAAYAGPFKGSRVVGKAVDVRFVSDDVRCCARTAASWPRARPRSRPRWPSAPRGSWCATRARGSSPCTRTARVGPAPRCAGERRGDVVG